MSTWSELSNELHKTVQAVGQSVITVQAESSSTVSGIVLDELTIVTTASAIGDGETIRAWVSPDQMRASSAVIEAPISHCLSQINKSARPPCLRTIRR